MSLVDDIRAQADEILSLRDQIGAVKSPVYILTRVWPELVGKGTPVDTFVQILPTPLVKNFDHSLKVREGGNIKQGDRLIKSISQQSYPTEAHVDCTVDSKVLERWYCIDGHTYEVINVNRRYVTWDVQVRKTSKNRVTIT